MTWANYENSTYTAPSRNIGEADWVAHKRKIGKKPVVIYGAGLVEAFMLAAHPQYLEAEILAVESDPTILGMVSDIKRGQSIPWNEIAKASKNPGRENLDLAETKRLRREIEVLSDYGVWQNLNGFSSESKLGVPSQISQRVTFIESDIRSALQKGQIPNEMTVCLDNFVQVNVAKSEGGKEYNQEVVVETVKKLSENGLYVIGTTGKDFIKAQKRIAKSEGQLAVSSLVHAVSLGDRYISSHYLVVNKNGEPEVDEEKIKKQVENIKIKYKLEERLVSGETTEDQVNIASTRSNRWNLATENLSLLVPENEAEFSETIIFPAQKPWCQRQ